MNTSKSATIIGGGLLLVCALKYIFSKPKQISQSSRSPPSPQNDISATIEMDSAGLANRVLRKAETVIQGRTSRVILVVERCTDDHNYSAIIRTAEALGIQHVWLVDPVVTIESGNEIPPITAEDDDTNEIRTFDSASDKIRYEHGKFARRATEWITVREFRTSVECIKALRDDNRTIWATDLSQKACCLTANDLPFNEESQSVIPKRLAVVFGTESVGVTEEFLEAADLRVYLPLRGFADSLNLSVAAALVMQHIFHLDSTVICSLSDDEKVELRKQWYPKMVAARGGTANVKRELRKIAHLLRDIDTIKDKMTFISQSSNLKSFPDKNKNKYELSNEQKEKLASEKDLKKREYDILSKIKKQAEIVVEEAIAHPPKPLGDVRRCDEHRTAFVGPNTRKKNQEHWKGMAATANDGGIPHPDAVPRIKTKV